MISIITIGRGVCAGLESIATRAAYVQANRGIPSTAKRATRAGWREDRYFVRGLCEGLFESKWGVKSGTEWTVMRNNEGYSQQKEAGGEANTHTHTHTHTTTHTNAYNHTIMWGLRHRGKTHTRTSPGHCRDEKTSEIIESQERKRISMKLNRCAWILFFSDGSRVL